MVKFETTSVDFCSIVKASVDALFNGKGIDRTSAWAFKTSQEKNGLFGELVGLIETPEGWFDVWMKASTVEVLPRLGYGVQIARDLLGRSARGRRTLRLADLGMFPKVVIDQGMSLEEKNIQLDQQLRLQGFDPQWTAIRVDAKAEKSFFIVMMRDFRQPMGFDLEASGFVEPCVWEDAPVLY